MIKIEDVSCCCGCAACATVCNHKAIKMVPDALGFNYPEVDIERCVHCNLCEKICPFYKGNEKQNVVPVLTTFAVRHKDINEIKTSRSGAAFIALSDKILENGGVVYGAGYSEDFRVIHKRAATKSERDEFKGSKYVQSKIGNIYHNVKEDLLNGLNVLFSGTPCQTAALKAFVGEKLRKNLYLIDFVCHGVASPYVWKDYLNYLKEKEKDNLIAVNFRDKNIFGWSGLHKESFTFKKKGLKTYDYVFYNSYIIRRSCNKCVFSNMHRVSDITLGDFWGWEKVVQNFNVDDTGVSLVICNSQKGTDLFNSAIPLLNVIPVKPEDCLQHNLQAPTQSDPRQDSFEDDYKQYGFRFVMKKYGDIGLMFQIKRSIRFIKRLTKL